MKQFIILVLVTILIVAGGFEYCVWDLTRHRSVVPEYMLMHFTSCDYSENVVFNCATLED